MERSRTFTWQDPMDGAEKAKHMSGLEYLQVMEEGKIALPPILHTMDFKVESIEQGTVVFSFIPQEFHYNPIGTVHGGVISTILDSALGCTLHSVLPQGKGYTSLELKVNFLRPIVINTGRIRAIGKIINEGGRTALVEAQLLDDKGKLYAHAVSTCMIF